MIRTVTRCALILCWTLSAGQAADAIKSRGPAVDLFEAIKAGQVDAKFIAMNDQEAKLLVNNKTKQPLTIKLPDSLVGVPALAQLAGTGTTGTRNSAPQPVGGGGYGGGNNAIGGGGNFLNIPPEKVVNVKIACVCLKHGAPNPTPQYPYELKSAEEFTTDTVLQDLLKEFAQGQVGRRVMQVAAWHIANNMSWDELAKKQIRHIGRPSEPYFSAAEMQSAYKLTTQIETAAKQRSTDTQSVSSPK